MSDAEDREESDMDPQDEDQETEGVAAASENVDDGSDDEDDQSAVASTKEEEEGSHGGGDEERSEASGGLDQEDDDDEKESVAPTGEGDDGASTGSPKSTVAGDKDEASTSPADGKKKKKLMPHARKGRAPAVKGLSIPFRTVKKAMKLDPDIPIVQNEAAIMTTMAAELFLKSLANESHRIAKTRGRNTIRYEDVAEARTKDSSLSFLGTLLP